MRPSSAPAPGRRPRPSDAPLDGGDIARFGRDGFLFPLRLFGSDETAGLTARFRAGLLHWGFSPPAVVTAWLAFTDSTPENGCVRRIPGLHRRGMALGFFGRQRGSLEASRAQGVEPRHLRASFRNGDERPRHPAPDILRRLPANISVEGFGAAIEPPSVVMPS